MAEEQVIIDVKVDVEQVQRDLSSAIQAVAALKDEQKMLKKAIEEGNDTHGEMAKRLAEVTRDLEKNNRVVRSNTALLQAQDTALLDTSASLNDQRQQLAQLQKLYGSLSGDAKKMADEEGGLAGQIKALTEQVKEQEHAIGDDRRNVGNYTESIGKLGDIASIAKGGLEGLAGGSTAASKAMDGVDKVAKAFSKNPLIGVLTLVVTALGVLMEKLRENEQQFQQIQVATASVTSVFKVFEPIIKKLSDVLQKTLLKALEFVTEAIKKMLGWLDKLGSYFGKNWGLSAAFESASEAAVEATKETENYADAVRKAREEAFKLWALQEEINNANKEAAEVMERLNGLEFTATAQAEALAAAQKKAADETAALMQIVQEEEQEGEDVPSVEEMARNRFGLDEEGVAYFKELLSQGVKAQDAAAGAQALRIAKQIRMYADLAKSASGSLSSIGESIASLSKDQQKAVVAQKAFGLASIIINEAVSAANTAAAITEAVAAATKAAAATGIAAPFTQPAFVATMVTTIMAAVAGTLSNIVQAKQLLQSADTDAGNFSGGGYVPGTSYTGDKMIAHVNSGEAIVPVATQRNFMDMVNGRLPAFDYDALAGVLVAAVAAQPAPVLDLQEFHDFEDKVVTFDEYAKI